MTERVDSISVAPQPKPTPDQPSKQPLDTSGLDNRIMENPHVSSANAQGGEIDIAEGTYLPLFRIERYNFDPVAIPDNQSAKQFWRIKWDQRAKSAPFLNLTPGDETTISGYGRVASTAVYKVDVVIVGSRSFSWKKAQWRASLVSLPHSDTQLEGV
jgi:hypothetical protein